MMDLSIIIVSYNTKELLVNCLNSIIVFTSNKISYEIIVIDNGSRDGSVEKISNLKPQISNLKFIVNNDNLGFAKANNIGVKEARGKYLLFLNSDTELIYEQTLEEMVAFMDLHKSTGAATCILQLADGTIDDAIHRGFPTPWNSICHFSGLGMLFKKSRFLNGYHLGWKDLDKVHEIDVLAGAFMMVRRKAGEQAGWWDEDYFFYGEDVDFCFRLKQLGWKIYFVPTTKILHHKGVSGGIKKHSRHLSIADNNTRIMIQKARFDAMRIFYKKHYTKIYHPLLTKLVLMGIALKQKFT